jgi:hypothetical protein
MIVRNCHKAASEYNILGDLEIKIFSSVGATYF